MIASAELNDQFASALILLDGVYSCLYDMLSDEINVFKLNDSNDKSIRHYWFILATQQGCYMKT